MAAVVESTAPAARGYGSQTSRARSALFESASLARSTAVLGAILLAGMAAGYAVQVLLARWMGAAQYGTYTNAIALASVLAVVAGLGLPTTVLRFVPRYLVENQLALLRGITRRAFQSVLICGLALAAATDAILLRSGYAEAGSAAAFRIAAWSIPLLALMQLSIESLRARGSAKGAYLTGNLLRPFALYAFTAALMELRGGLSAAEAAAATVAALLAVIAVQLSCLVTRPPREAIAAAPRYEYRLWARVAAPMLGTGLLMAALDASDILVLGALTTAENVGIYVAALRTSRLISFVLGATLAHAAPTFALFHATGDKSRLQESLGTISHLTFWPALALALPMLIWPGSVLGVFGGDFSGGSRVLTVLAISQLVNVGAGPVYYLLQMTAHQDDVFYLMALIGATQIVLEVMFVRWWGVTGAAIATALSFIGANVCMHALVVHRLGVRCSILAGIGNVRCRVLKRSETP